MPDPLAVHKDMALTALQPLLATADVDLHVVAIEILAHSLRDLCMTPEMLRSVMEDAILSYKD